MSDRKRILTIDPVTLAQRTLIDLDDGTTYAAVRGSFEIQQGGRNQALAATGTRYGGQRVAGESSDNDKVSWQALVAGNTVDEVLENCEAILAVTEDTSVPLYIEWRASGATRSTLYEIRGPAEFQLEHEAVRLEGGKAEYVTLSFPVAPLAQGFPGLVRFPAATLPQALSVVAGASAPPDAGQWTNLIKNPSVETDTTGWAATACALSRPTGVAGDTGTYALRATASGSAVFNVAYTDAGAYMPVTAGETYTASLDLLGQVGTRSHELQIRWYDVSDALLSTSSVEISGTGRKSLTAVAPANATQAAVAVAATTTGAGTDTVTIDAAMFVGGEYSTYFDGSTAGCHWHGTANASASSMNPPAGTAPAKIDFEGVFNTSTSYDYVTPWALLSAWKKPSAASSGLGLAPLGIFSAENDGENFSNLTTTAGGEYVGGAGRYFSVTAAAGSGSCTFPLDTSLVDPDAFSNGSLEVELWARVVYDPDLIGGRVLASLIPADGEDYGPIRYTPEFGSSGKEIVAVPSGSIGKFRLVRLGTMPIPVEHDNPQDWNLKITMSVTGGTGSFILDCVVAVPARGRACGPTGVTPSLSTYPYFVKSLNTTRRLILSDLRGYTGAGAAGVLRPSAGLGGAPLEGGPGNIEVLAMPSSEVPDDPTANANDAQGFFNAVDVVLRVTPRYHLVR